MSDRNVTIPIKWSVIVGGSAILFVVIVAALIVWSSFASVVQVIN